MNHRYYKDIGKIMVHTWLENFPSDYKLHLYLEDFTIDLKDNRLVIEDWKDVQNLYEIWRETRGTDVFRDQKFTKKALTQICLWRKYSGKMIWLDADTFSIKKIPSDFFDIVIEDYPLASWGHEQFESGTVFINIDHTDFEPIRKTYESIYIGERGLPLNQRWYDGELLGWACIEAGSKHLNLRKYCTAKTSTPLNRSWIGEYIRHLKAKQKITVKETLINEFRRYDLAALLEE
jgi:hypothetical protein